jgi:hypothetical protein
MLRHSGSLLKSTARPESRAKPLPRASFSSRTARQSAYRAVVDHNYFQYSAPVKLLFFSIG